MSFLDRLFGTPRQPEPATGDPDRVRAVEVVLDDVRPLVEIDGGDVRLVAVEGDWVHLRFSGACRGCAAQGSTLLEGIEPRLRAALPWLAGVRSV